MGKRKEGDDMEEEDKEPRATFFQGQVQSSLKAHFMLLLDKSPTRSIPNAAPLVSPVAAHALSNPVQRSGGKGCRREPVLSPHQGIASRAFRVGIL